MDILRTAWLPTDAGTLTPTEALSKANTLNWKRGDWEMASLCLLHAMVQTAIVLESGRCPNRRAWESLRQAPPVGIEGWFDWPIGDHPWECMTADGLVPVARLLPDSPGDNAIKKCSDIARWQQDVPVALTLPEATIALISDNLWGTRIGTGFYQGARGEQSLTTLVEPASRNASLWERVWLNALPADEWNKSNNTGCAEPFAFPWNQPLPGQPLTPDNTHGAGILWQMPRRWRIVQDADSLVRHVHRENKGRDYSGWEKLHPLTPYFVKADGTWTAAKVGAHTGFRDWAAIALSGRKNSRPATVVGAYVQMAWQQEPLRLRCCGWALADAGAPGGWVDHVVPFYLKGEDQADNIEAAVQDSELQRYRLSKALDEARRGLGRQASHLYVRAERKFYERVAADAWDSEREDWKRDLKKFARELYWATIESHRVDPFQAAKASQRI
jgi:hypothetical protein